MQDRSKWLEIAITALVAINMALTGWCLTQIVDNKTDLAEIKGNRFTSNDGLAVWKEIACIRENIAKLPDQYPPKWWVERQDKFEADMKSRLGRLEELLMNHIHTKGS
jgi:hypothetical protein